MDTPQNRFQVENLQIEIHPDAASAGHTAARVAAEAMRELVARQGSAAVLFATGASQLKMLAALVNERDIPWNKIDGFHLDEYVGLSPDHPASFRHYLRQNLTTRVPLRSFTEINGSSADPEFVCRAYTQALSKTRPSLCLLGIGENGHLAFNDPAVANFEDVESVKVVALDGACRNQQVAEGWFSTLADVPRQAITLTIPTIFRVPRLIVSVPGPRKAQIVLRTLHDPISTACPATILRRHPRATLYLDRDSASELDLDAVVRGRAFRAMSIERK